MQRDDAADRRPAAAGDRRRSGVATAAGCQLVATCDLAVASRTARFATPGVDIGLFCSTPMVALSRNVSPKHAMEMLLTGDMITAEEAARIGLVNRVVDPGTERDDALTLAHKIAAKSGHTVGIGKAAFYRQPKCRWRRPMHYAAETMTREHDGARRRRRHRRLHRKARAEMGRPMTRANALTPLRTRSIWRLVAARHQPRPSRRSAWGFGHGWRSAGPAALCNAAASAPIMPCPRPRGR